MKIHRSIPFAVLQLVVSSTCDAFQLVQPKQNQHQYRRSSSGSNFALQASSTPLVLGIPLLGRFRKKRTVDQTKVIAVGDVIPDVDVELIEAKGEDGQVISSAVSIRQILGNETSILVGMPGAFTPTCTRKHLPGYIDNAPRFAELGIEKIAVVTTNDRFVNEEWSNQFGLLNSEGKESVVTVLCDGDGDLVRSMGLADDMGFGVGIRSKRFALVAENGVITTLLTDEGMDDCSKTSADSLLQVLAPEPAVTDADESPLSNTVIGGAVAGVALLLLLSSALGGGDGQRTTSPPTPSPQPVIRSEPAKTPKGGDKTSFSLLNEYL